MEPLGLLIGAALGSAGIGGLVASAIQYSRASRASRSVDRLRKSLEGASSETAGAKALKVALDVDRVRLASISIIRPPQLAGPMLITLVLGVAFFFLIYANGIYPGASDRDGDGVAGEVNQQWLWWSVAAAAGYILVLAISLDTVIQLRRERFVRQASKPKADIEILARSRGGKPGKAN